MATLLDTAAAFQFIRKLNTPITSMDAYKLGLIDSNGHRTEKPIITFKEKDSLSYFNIIILNLKKLLAKLPGGASKLGTVAATLLLLKEENLNEIELEDKFSSYYKKVSKYLIEDGDTVAVNNIGGGNIAGAGVPSPTGQPSNFGDPPIRKRVMNKYKSSNMKEANKVTSIILGMVKRNK